MSLNIWTQCEGRSNATVFIGEAWRVIEDQHLTGTRKLVDSDAEREVLEALIDRQKPTAPKGQEYLALHPLLSTPFRYPPLRHGSRFGTRAQRGIWYGAAQIATVLAEVAYYRFVFLLGSEASFEPIESHLSAFRAAFYTQHYVDLSHGPFQEYRFAIADPQRYEATQALGLAMRDAGIELFSYPSARDPGGGNNLAALSPKAFSAKQPQGFRRWHCVATVSKVEFVLNDYLGAGRFEFDRSIFEIEGELPLPAL